MFFSIMAKVGLAIVTRAPRRTKILALVALALSTALLLDWFLVPAEPAKPVEVAFCGFTNLPGGKCAVFTLQNQSRRVMELRNFNYMEYYKRPVAGSGNASRRYTTGTNFVFLMGQRRDLALPVSEEGQFWKVYFEFERTGLQTKLANYLQTSQGVWVRFVPEMLRTPWNLEVVFCLRSDSLEIPSKSPPSQQVRPARHDSGAR